MIPQIADEYQREAHATVQDVSARLENVNVMETWREVKMSPLKDRCNSNCEMALWGLHLEAQAAQCPIPGCFEEGFLVVLILDAGPNPHFLRGDPQAQISIRLVLIYSELT